jgi:hypothetical protein
MLSEYLRGAQAPIGFERSHRKACGFSLTHWLNSQPRPVQVKIASSSALVPKLERYCFNFINLAAMTPDTETRPAEKMRGLD